MGPSAIKFRPGPDEIERGAIYTFTIGNVSGDPGEIFSKTGELLWTFKQDNCFKVFSNNAEVVRISRLKYFPAEFEIRKDGERVGSISMYGLLRNRYRIEIEPSVRWNFNMPLFSVNFDGASELDHRLWVTYGPPTKRRWSVLICEGADRIELVSALAFIHRRWRRC